MRTVSLPVSACLNTVNWVLRSWFALLTGMLNESQSPAGEMVFAVMSFSLSQALTASTVSGLGARNASV